MKLTHRQHEDFDRDGCLFSQGLFTPRKTAVLNAAVPELYQRRAAYNVSERGADAVRANFAEHMCSEPFARRGPFRGTGPLCSRRHRFTQRAGRLDDPVSFVPRARVDLPWKDGLPASALKTAADELQRAA